MRHLDLAALVSLIALAGAPACPAGALFGAHVGSASDPHWQTDLTDFETQIGRKLAIDSDYADWAAFPNTARVKWDIQTGRLPMQSWRVLFQESKPHACATAAAISAGTYDVQLKKQAATLKSLGGTILVRFNYEMTDNQENTCFTGFDIDRNMKLAGQKYINAWRHVVGVFRGAGATNVKWVWAPGAAAYIHNDWNLFYPGANYVDWIGIDNYNKADVAAAFGVDPGTQQFYADMAPLGKPMMISENAAIEDPSQGPDAQTVWINSARTYLEAHPQIAAYVYWDSTCAHLPPPPYQGSGYVPSSAGLAAFKAMANDPYFTSFATQVGAAQTAGQSSALTK